MATGLGRSIPNRNVAVWTRAEIAHEGPTRIRRRLRVLNGLRFGRTGFFAQSERPGFQTFVGCRSRLAQPEQVGLRLRVDLAKGVAIVRSQDRSLARENRGNRRSITGVSFR